MFRTATHPHRTATATAFDYVWAPRTWTRDTYVKGHEEKQTVTTTFTWAGNDQGLAHAILAIARWNDLTGAWATAAQLADMTGVNRSTVNRQLKRIREIADANGNDRTSTLRYSKVGNTWKYQVNADA